MLDLLIPSSDAMIFIGGIGVTSVFVVFVTALNKKND